MIIQIIYSIACKNGEQSDPRIFFEHIGIIVVDYWVGVQIKYQKWYLLSKGAAEICKREKKLKRKEKQ